MMNKKIVALVSCMYQNDFSIIERMNIQTDAVVINQCDKNSTERIYITNKKGQKCEIIFLNTTQRGLSNSRNMAIANAPAGSIVLICDEDEILCDNYENLIREGYSYFSNPDMVFFKIGWSDFGKTYPTKPHKLSYIQALRVCSVQISFLVDKVRDLNISFDPKMGSGSGNGAGEENKFIIDCRKNKFSQFYYPNEIALISQGESQWFKGFDKKYFENFGWSSRRIHQNLLFSLLYILYYSIAKYHLYKKSCSFFVAISSMFNGLFIEK